MPSTSHAHCSVTHLHWVTRTCRLYFKHCDQSSAATGALLVEGLKRLSVLDVGRSRLCRLLAVMPVQMMRAQVNILAPAPSRAPEKLASTKLALGRPQQAKIPRIRPLTLLERPPQQPSPCKASPQRRVHRTRTISVQLAISSLLPEPQPLCLDHQRQLRRRNSYSLRYLSPIAGQGRTVWFRCHQCLCKLLIFKCGTRAGDTAVLD